VDAGFCVIGLARYTARRHDEGHALALLLPEAAWSFPSAGGASRSARQLAVWRPAFLLLQPGFEQSTDVDGNYQS